MFAAEMSQSSLDETLEISFQAFTDEELIEELTKEIDYPEATLDLVMRFARTIANGAWRGRVNLDRAISAAIPDYDYSRLAGVDRNVLRLALYELNEIPYIPPAVTLNEAIEMAKKYSTAESGKFVNGVLATLLQKSAKADYDAKNAPSDPDLGEAERIFYAPKPEIEEETVEESSPEGKIAKRYGVWQIRNEDES
jgi:transcription antitermination factor NusB